MVFMSPPQQQEGAAGRHPPAWLRVVMRVVPLATQLLDEPTEDMDVREEARALPLWYRGGARVEQPQRREVPQNLHAGRTLGEAKSLELEPDAAIAKQLAHKGANACSAVVTSSSSEAPSLADLVPEAPVRRWGGQKPAAQ